MKYQLCTEKTAYAPIRNSWEEAAQDAVNRGLAHWGYNTDEIIFRPEFERFYIARIEEKVHIKNSPWWFLLT